MTLKNKIENKLHRVHARQNVNIFQIEKIPLEEKDLNWKHENKSRKNEKKIIIEIQ